MSRFRNWTSMIQIDQLPIRASYLTCYLSNTLILFQDVRSNLVLGEVCWIQHYVIKFVSDLWQVGGFSLDTLNSSTNKTDRHNTAEILLKVPLNTIILIPSRTLALVVQNYHKGWQFRAMSACDPVVVV
jgi:hypothetical protein